MARPCTICQHEQRAEIDAALVESAPNRRVAAQFGFSEQAVRRHKAAHLPAAMARASEAAAVARGDDLMGQVREQQARVGRLFLEAEAVLAAAKKAGKLRIVLSAVRTAAGTIHEARGGVDLMARLLGELNDSVTVLLDSPEWLDIRNRIIRALQPYPEAGAAVVAALKGEDVEPAPKPAPPPPPAAPPALPPPTPATPPEPEPPAALASPPASPAPPPPAAATPAPAAKPAPPPPAPQRPRRGPWKPEPATADAEPAPQAPPRRRPARSSALDDLV